MSPDFVSIGAAVLFALAVLHTFSVKFFDRLAGRHPRHAGVLHWLAEVEVVFGFWALILILYLAVFNGKDASLEYLESRNFTEPMFVFAIMVVAASKPILDLSRSLVSVLSRLLPLQQSVAIFFMVLFLVPLLGSLITEPAAMTLAALLLRDYFFSYDLSQRFKYAIVGVLFVNISIGGTLTPFAAPPILMVATTWNWDLLFMLEHFGWRSAVAVLINAAVLTWVFRKELVDISLQLGNEDQQATSMVVTFVHLLFLLGIVAFAHHAVVFMGLLLFFIGYTVAYQRFQQPLIIRESLLVAFFLAGLVVLGGQQQWWLQELLNDISPTMAYYGAAALTAITDNAALTYLGSLVDGLSYEFKYSLVAGAVTGGGLTVIANAPNPAGYSILKAYFKDGHISALGILLAALLPTCVAILAFRLV